MNKKPTPPHMREPESHVDYLEKLWNKKPCRHPSHNFPTGLYIRPGESYTHTCPACGKSQTVTAPDIFN